MTWEVLEGTALDLGPEFWAFVVVIALFAIDYFQLGPHSFSKADKSQKKQKKAGKSRQAKHPTARKRHQHAPIRLDLFQTIIASNAIYLSEQGALLYIGKGGEDIQLRPKPPEKNISNEVYPQTSQLDNYVMADGDHAEDSVLNQFTTLWSIKDRAGVKHIVFYSIRCPSIYAIQRIAETLGPYAGRGVGVSVLYLEEDREEESVEEKAEHLDKAGITLERLT